MRIIAGSARGRTIIAPKGQDTRPTQDYVRESLFNILQQIVPQAYVLDLFSGSGALALEAISRGAEFAALVDLAPQAITCIRKNVQSLGFEEQTAVLQCKWQAAIARLAGKQHSFTLVFLDPPYRMTETGEICAEMAERGILENDAMIVIEHRKGCDPTLDDRFTCKDSRRYGDTVIHFYVYHREDVKHA